MKRVFLCILYNYKSNKNIITKKLKANAGDAEVIEVPEGDPIFLFNYAVGRTRPINVFSDPGCQGAIKYGRLAEFLPGKPDFHRKFGLF